MEIAGLCNLKNFHMLDGADIITTSLFKMENGYKDFNKYTDNLESIKTTLNNKFPKSKIVLFIDDSITNDNEIYHKIKKLEGEKFVIIEYSCDKFRNNNKNRGHIELFGTLMRMLPMFDFPGNKTKTVASIDADTNKNELTDFIKEYKIYKKLNTDYHYVTNIIYAIFVKWSSDTDYDILAGKQFCKIKFPIHILTDYLECMKTKTCEDYDSITKTLYNEKYSVYPYGVDEYFLNYRILPFLKKNNIRYSVMAKYEITAPLFYAIRTRDIASKNAISELLGKMYGKGDHKSLFKKFDNMFYMINDDKATNEQKEKAKQYYKEIEQLKKNKDYRVFNSKILEIILKHKKTNMIGKTYVHVFEGEQLVKKYNIVN